MPKICFPRSRHGIEKRERLAPDGLQAGMILNNTDSKTDAYTNITAVADSLRIKGGG